MSKSYRSYSAEDKGAALLALDLNKGFVKPTAQQLEIPRDTLNTWSKKEDPAAEAAKGEILQHKNVQKLAETLFRLAQAGADHALANIGDASPYHGALIGAIALDKWSLITGRPTSRTEVLRARYVDPDALRKISQEVIDVEAKRLPDPA